MFCTLSKPHRNSPTVFSLCDIREDRLGEQKTAWSEILFCAPKSSYFSRISSLPEIGCMTEGIHVEERHPSVGRHGGRTGTDLCFGMSCMNQNQLKLQSSLRSLHTAWCGFHCYWESCSLEESMIYSSGSKDILSKGSPLFCVDLRRRTRINLFPQNKVFFSKQESGFVSCAV